MSDPTCLQCGERRSKVRAESLFCGILSGYETPEVGQEWERHRWADWTDRELAAHGVKPEAFETHRRTDASIFHWIDCDDTVRGHAPAKDQDAAMLGVRLGQCIFCGHDGAA